jgi:hypothetical protein
MSSLDINSFIVKYTYWGKTWVGGRTLRGTDITDNFFYVFVISWFCKKRWKFQVIRRATHLRLTFTYYREFFNSLGKINKGGRTLQGRTLQISYYFFRNIDFTEIKYNITWYELITCLALTQIHLLSNIPIGEKLEWGTDITGGRTLQITFLKTLQNLYNSRKS